MAVVWHTLTIFTVRYEVGLIILSQTHMCGPCQILIGLRHWSLTWLLLRQQLTFMQYFIQSFHVHLASLADQAQHLKSNLKLTCM